MTTTNWRRLEGITILLIVIVSVIVCFFQLIIFLNQKQASLQGQLIGLIIFISLIFSISYLVYLSILYLHTLKLLESSINTNLRNNKQLLSDPIIGIRIIKPILEIHIGSESFDYKNLLNLEYNRNITKRQYVNYSIGIMITLGILGTFIGLVDSVQESSNILDSIGTVQNGNELARKFKAPFSGMNTAFNTSIIGIIGAVILGFLNSFVDKLTNFLFIDLEKQIQLQLIPELFPKQKSVERLVLVELEKINNNYSNIFNSVKSELDRLIGNITLQQNDLKIFTREMITTISKTIEMFNTSLDRAHEIHRAEANLRHEAYLVGLEKLITIIGKNTDVTKETIINYSAKVDEYLKTLKASFIESLNKHQTTFSENLILQGKRFNTEIQKMQESINKKIGDSIKRNDSQMENLYKSSADHASELSKVYKDETKKFIDNLERTLEEKNLQLIVQIHEALKSFNVLQEKISSHLKSTTMEIQEESKHMITVYRMAQDEYLEKIKIFQTTFEKYILNIEEANIILENSNNLFLGLTNSYDQHSDNLGIFQERVNQTTSDYVKLIKSLKEETTDLGKTFQLMSNTFEGLRKEEGKISATFEQLLDVVFRNLDSNGKN